MLLIAIDEAGYGPKLGPLIIVATAWEVPLERIDQARLDTLFGELRTAQECDGTQVVIEDSKAVYQSGDGLQMLHAAVSASHHWCGRRESTLPAILPLLAGEDFESIVRTSWLDRLAGRSFLEPAATDAMRTVWGQSGVRQVDTQARVITAARFNQACGAGANKAELLSESTLALVRTLLAKHGRQQPSAAVFCDRHGGRKFYAGVLQHTFPEAIVQVVSESNRQSVYRLAMSSTGGSRQTVTVHFTVNGDSFTPVAFSSIHAKYLRERFMESFNGYFGERHRGSTPLKPTAGYPVDADRFLEQIADIVQRENISRDRLVRSR